MITKVTCVGLAVAHVLAIASVAPTRAQAADEPARQVTVQGSCLRAVQPDRGSLTVTADIPDKELQGAVRKATESYERVKRAVQKLGLKDAELTTSEYNLQEIREWEKDRQVFKGFRARMGLTVATSDLNRLGEVIALAAKEGLREVSSLTTFLSEERLKLEREACLEVAVKNARAKAESMARAEGSKVGRVLRMSESGTPDHRPRPEFQAQEAAAKMAMDAAIVAPSISAGPVRVTTDVTVSFHLQ